MKLYERRAELVSSLAGSTTTCAVELAAFVDKALAEKEARAANAAASSRKRSQKLRAEIGEALGALPLHWPGTPGVVLHRLAIRGIECHDDTVRDEIKRRQQIAANSLAGAVAST